MATKHHHHYHHISNGHGWKLELKQCRLPQTIDSKRNPVLMVPGYGMNSFIFGYHPHGVSFEEFLTQSGFEVWSLNFRAQKGTLSEGGAKNYTMKDLALYDLKQAINFVSKHTKSKNGKVDIIGCSLGGTLACAYASLVKNNKMGSLIAMGSPLRWEEVNPVVKALMVSPKLVGMIPVMGAKEVMKFFFPLLMKSAFLKLYINTELIDLRRKEILLETVEDPNQFMNRDIARWIKNKDLIIDGHNITKKFSKLNHPLLCVIANNDGIVPMKTALSLHDLSKSENKKVLFVGDTERTFAHADLFISPHAHEMVFEPIAEWLVKH